MIKDDRACALVLLGIAIAACIGASRHVVGTFNDPGPGLFPMGLGVVLGVLSLIILGGGILAARREKQESGAAEALSGKVSKEALYVIGSLVAFGVLLVPLGFLLTTFLVFASLLRLVADRRWSLVLGGAAVLALGSYLIFDILLGVTLPRGILAF